MGLDIERIKAICFDVDGTLSDTDDSMVQKLTTSLRKVFFWIPPWKVKKAARKLVMFAESPANAVYRLMDWMHIDPLIAYLFNKISKNSKGSRRKHYWIIRGTDHMLKALAEHYPLSVVSARDGHTTEQFLTQFQLVEMFQAIVTAQTCTYTKPYPHPMLHASELMGVAPENCLMVGDTVVDILAGKRAGMQTLGVLCGFGTENELRRAGADSIVETTTSLTHLLDIPVTYPTAD